MNLLINVTTEDSCKVSVQDITGVSDTGYLAEGSSATVLNRFKYTDTVAIDLLQHNKSTGPALQTPIYTLRTIENEVSVLPVNFDGWFTALHIVIPNVTWFDTEKAKVSGSALDLYTTVYYSDGIAIYKYINGESTVASLEELVERNTDGTTISKVCENYLSICFLNKCYLSLCQQLLNNRGFSICANKNDVDSDTYTRWAYVKMALDVIKYMVELGQLAEAERIIEQISGCNGLCKTEFKRMPTNKCGCGR